MKKLYISFLLVFLMITLNSCSIIGGIFKAGAFVGILAVVVIVAIIIWIVSMFRGKS
jgi:uncharacterized membrane protein